ncbi:MAG: hypothetical protein A2Y12_08740 [Planctomycetes bacterium GWF2_42_9]|nr:MAG: hypothetical protein A2Y12_08740 [Planctomycetes bacterium GWF2_42_9]HAL45484.1 hypothetical protein [Phycisphaerales bacterium]
MAKKILKRSYNFPAELLDSWKKFHGSSTKDYSASAAAAFLLYMIVEGNIRDEARRLAFEKNIDRAKLDVRVVLRETLADAYRSGYIGIHSAEDKMILIRNNTRIETIAKIEDEVKFTEIFKLLSDEDQKAVMAIRDGLGPDQKQKSRTA